jgi:hypothetical protein
MQALLIRIHRVRPGGPVSLPLSQPEITKEFKCKTHSTVT